MTPLRPNSKGPLTENEEKIYQNDSPSKISSASSSGNKSKQSQNKNSLIKPVSAASRGEPKGSEEKLDEIKKSGGKDNFGNRITGSGRLVIWTMTIIMIMLKFLN